MRFGKTLSQAIHAPWKEHYVDYGKLKSLLRDDKDDEEGAVTWTEEDENRFSDEIFNVQLEKVARFQEERVEALGQRLSTAFDRLRELGTTAEAEQPLSEQTIQQLRELDGTLDEITNEVRELKKYSSINYTAFLKTVKKHDRKRGSRYKIRPMMQLALAQRPFNSEQGFSPLLNRLSTMYYAIRQQLGGGDPALPDLESQRETHNGERYTAHKFWVHVDNLLEVKTLILRRLPALVYSEHSARELDGNDSPPITSLYFDNNNFEIYSDKVNRQSEASSLRLRWHGQLSSRPDIFFERKTADAKGNSQEDKFVIKDKWIKPFLDGEDTTEKRAQKMARQGASAERIDSYKGTVAKIRELLQQKKLSPVLRANYMRTAFQKPTDDRVRISIDTQLAFIREDTLDARRPCRDPAEWHRHDVDDSGMTYPFRNINQSEVSQFPHAVLEIKLKDDGARKRPSWVEDLMVSHLVHPVPRFSKFVHGIASLFEDYVNTLPFWLSDLETDIRKDPQRSFEEEEERRAQRADDANAVGSLVGTMRSGSYRMALSSSRGRSFLAERMATDASAKPSLSQSLRQSMAGRSSEEAGESSSGREALTQSLLQEQQLPSGSGSVGRGYGSVLSSVLPSLSFSRYAQAKQAQQQRRQQQRQLPEGVVEPTQWIKNMGEVKVEPKVWLANERTFLKWQHICILQGSLAVGLYTAAAAASGRRGGDDRDNNKDNRTAQIMGGVYVAIAAFAGLWGYGMLRVRRRMIVERSGKHFDNMFGPIVVSVSLMVALVLNFILQYQKVFGGRDGGDLLKVSDEL